MQYLKKILITLCLVVLFVAPVVLLKAQVSTPGGQDSTPGTVQNDKNTPPPVPNKNLNLSLRIQNPIKADNLITLVDQILGMILKIAIPVIAILFILAGFKYVMARGNQSEIKKAHDNLLNLFIGTFIVLGAYTIGKAIVATIESVLK